MKALRTARWFCVAALMAVAGVWGQPVPPVVAPVPSAAPPRPAVGVETPAPPAVAAEAATPAAPSAAPAALPAAVAVPPAAAERIAPVPVPLPRPVPLPVPGAEPFREVSIYLPYDDLRRTFEATGRGVFLPYEDFQALWQAARRATQRPPELPAPVDFLISEIHGDATITQDVLQVKADLRLEVIREGWHQIPIRLGDVALTQAVLDDAPARLVPGPDGHALLVEHRGAVPRVLTLSLEFAKAYEKAPGRNRVSFEAPVAPVSRWDIRIPEAGVSIDVVPMVAATVVPPAPGVVETHVQAFVGAAPTLRLEWTPKAEGARGLKALAALQADLLVQLDEGVVRTRATLDYSVSRAELGQVQVAVPADQKVVSVFDPNVREWSVTEVSGEQVVTATLFEPARERQRLVLELERLGSEMDVQIPVVRALDVGRQQGRIGLRLAGGLRIAATRLENLVQIDAAELSGPDGSWDSAFRYAALPCALGVRLEKIRPRLVAETLVELHVQPDEVTAEVRVSTDVQRAGVFQLSLQVPVAWEVREVRGEAIGAAPAAEVEAHQRAEGHPERLVVTLARQAQGPVGLAVRLSRRLAEPDLLAPTGKAVALPLGLPRADPEAVLRENGRLVVYGPDSLRLSPQQTQGLRGIAPAVAVEGFPSTYREGEERPAMGFAFGADPVALTVSAERRRPHLTVGQLLVMRIASGVVRFEATLQLQVLYSGVSSLRLDLPEAVAAVARVTSPGIRYRVIDDPAGRPDLLPGMVAWSLSGDTEFLGGVPIGVVWEMPLAQLDVGSTVDIAVPRLVPRGVDRAWGQLVLAKAESIEVTPAEDRRGLRAIDPQHDLMPGARAGDAAHAFEFHDDWALTVQATRYEPKDVKATSIERGLVTAVVTRGDLTSVQAVYAMRSARQRLTVHLPGEVDFDTQPLHINGRPVALEQGAGGDYVIPLTGQTPQAAFLVELRYTVRGQGLAIAPPSFPEEPAAQRLCLSLYLPQERAYLGHRGPWNDEIVWTIRGFSSWPRGRQSQAGLQAWVAGPLTEGRDRLGSFATDGRHLLFATLRPIPGPEGALRVAAVSEVLLRAVVVLVGLALGLALLRSSGSRRAVVIGALFCAGLLAAVFVPSLSRACLSNAAVAAGLVVLVLWGLWHLVVVRPRDPRLQARRQAREEHRDARRDGAVPPPMATPPAAPPAAPAAAAAAPLSPPPPADGKPDTDQA